MPYYNSPLLSSWSPQFMTSSLHYPPPPKIPLQILNSVKTNDNIAYAALPKELRGRRNVISVAPRKQSARFRSGKTHSVDVCIISLRTTLLIAVFCRNPILPCLAPVVMRFQACIVMSRSSTPNLVWKTLILGKLEYCSSTTV